ncbi:TIGR00730 family Rossman fold protein [Thalassobacillus sp. C254]|uniref:LOG family protein n=1 Tax=Thalassobacillus sp. C254 TaxID=1225341 RepID=UPI0006CFFFF6|nr:TIGR00730 family Rossman fold protein [Thalassobacillus sp. C254]
MKHITVFCGSRNGNRSLYLQEAKKLGEELAQNKIITVYGGGSSGLMGAVADGALGRQGEVIGIVPETLKDIEIAHQHVTELITVKTMHERKAKMYEYADAFIALPGGIGTLEEFVEVLTWYAIGQHEKYCALLNTDHYYDPLLTLIKHMVKEGFLSEQVADRIIVFAEPQSLVHFLVKGEKENV